MRSNRNPLCIVYCLLVMVLCLVLASCSGGGGSSSSNQNPTITSVSVSCSPTSVLTNGTATCTAAVTGTGSFSSAVTWSASAGTVNANGNFTAPATAGSATVTATSTEDTSKSGNATITVTIPAVAVSISPQTVSVPSGWTQQFTATVTNTTNTAVTWSATLGTISNTGLLSLAGVAQGTTGTVTVTSVADSTKSAQAQVTVTQRQIVLATPISTISIPSLSYKAIFGFMVSAKGIQVGDIASVTFLGQTATATIDSTMIANSGFEYNGSFALGDYAPGFIKFTVASSDGTIQANPVWTAVVTDMPVLAKDATTAYFNPGYPFTIQEYSLATGVNTGTISTENNASIAIDKKTGTLLIGASPVGWTINRWLNGSWMNTIYDPNPPQTLAAQGGYGYVVQPFVSGQSGNTLGQFDLTQANPTITSISAGDHPWTIDTATVNNADAIVVYSQEDTTINLVSNSLAVESFLPLTGITKASVVTQNTYGFGGGWPIQIFGSGPEAGTVAFLSAPDKSLVTATIDSSSNLHFANQLTLSGLPVKIAKDEADGKIIVTYFDAVNGKMTLTSFDVATLTPTVLTSSSSLPVGFDVAAVLVSDDGTTLYVAGIDGTGTPGFLVLQNK